MKGFEYAAPSKLDEVTSMLGDSWGETEILAGGTDLITSIKQQITQPKRVVSLRNVSALKGLSKNGNSIRIGAMCSLAECAENKDVQQNFPALVTAIKNISSPQMLHMGTVGGDLCQRPRCWFFRNGFGLFGKEGDTALVPQGDNRYHAIFGNEGPALFVSASSLGPALIALGAKLTISGPKNDKREVNASDFFQTPKTEQERETVLKPHEVLTEIHVPITSAKNGTYEVRHRHGLDWPYVTASVAFQMKNGVAQNAKVVLGHVAPTPWPVAAAGKLLDGKAIDEGAAAQCGQAAMNGAKPLSGNGYKVALVKAAVSRAILAAAKA
jgi:xanthine dehydrogenase YagS FAD-binding subunit